MKRETSTKQRSDLKRHSTTERRHAPGIPLDSLLTLKYRRGWMLFKSRRRKRRRRLCPR
jgi:hypothetical protein